MAQLTSSFFYSMTCPVAYCFDCAPDAYTEGSAVRTSAAAASAEQLERMGIHSTKSYLFFQCNECAQEGRATLASSAGVRAGKMGIAHGGVGGEQHASEKGGYTCGRCGQPKKGHVCNVVDNSSMEWAAGPHPVQPHPALPEGGGSSQTEAAASRYRCGRCGQPKKGHVCNVVDKSSMERAAGPHPVLPHPALPEGGGSSQTEAAASRYRCGRCGQPKKGHVCNVVDKSSMERATEAQLDCIPARPTPSHSNLPEGLEGATLGVELLEAVPADDNEEDTILVDAIVVDDKDDTR